MTNKTCYKLEIWYNKYSPFIIALLIFISNIFDYFGFHYNGEGYLFVPSLLTSFHMYVSRRTFEFCEVHRCAVNYVVFNTIIYMIKDNLGTFSSLEFLIFDILIALIFSIRGYYLYKKSYRYNV